MKLCFPLRSVCLFNEDLCVLMNISSIKLQSAPLNVVASQLTQGRVSVSTDLLLDVVVVYCPPQPP